MPGSQAPRIPTGPSDPYYRGPYRRHPRNSEPRPPTNRRQSSHHSKETTTKAPPHPSSRPSPSLDNDPPSIPPPPPGLPPTSLAPFSQSQPLLGQESVVESVQHNQLPGQSNSAPPINQDPQSDHPMGNCQTQQTEYSVKENCAIDDEYLRAAAFAIRSDWSSSLAGFETEAAKMQWCYAEARNALSQDQQSYQASQPDQSQRPAQPQRPGQAQHSTSARNQQPTQQNKKRKGNQNPNGQSQSSHQARTHASGIPHPQSQNLPDYVADHTKMALYAQAADRKFEVEKRLANKEVPWYEQGSAFNSQGPHSGTGTSTASRPAEHTYSQAFENGGKLHRRSMKRAASNSNPRLDPNVASDPNVLNTAMRDVYDDLVAELTPGGQNNHTKPCPSDKPPHLTDGLGRMILSIGHHDATRTTFEKAEMQGLAVVASYNWVGGRYNPTIAIPGAPPMWERPVPDPTLRSDDGIDYADVNAVNYPRHPMEAAAESVIACKKLSDPSATDLFACQNTLCMLLRFLKGDAQYFRIMVEAVGNTVFFTRRERAPDTQFRPLGFGYSMPRAYTRWHDDLKDSKSHQRIVSFSFSGLKVLVRSRCDAFLAEELKQSFDQVDPLGSITLPSSSPDASVPAKTAEDTLVLFKAGLDIDQNAIATIKTLSKYREDSVKDGLLEDNQDRLWATGTSFLIMGFHSFGYFGDIRIKDVRQCNKWWASENRPLIAKLGDLLTGIIKYTKEAENQQLELYSFGRDLQIRLPGKDYSPALSANLKARWVKTPGNAT